MATTCRTSDGDLLGTICHNFYGHLNGSVEAVLDANQGLAEELQPYRTGVVIVLSDLAASAQEHVTLWDLWTTLMSLNAETPLLFGPPCAGLFLDKIHDSPISDRDHWVLHGHGNTKHYLLSAQRSQSTLDTRVSHSRPLSTPFQ